MWVEVEDGLKVRLPAKFEIGVCGLGAEILLRWTSRSSEL
jgi:hypothetical protein